MHAVEHAEVVSPEPGFVGDGGVQQRVARNLAGVGAEELPEQFRGQPAVALLREVHPVDRQRLGRLGKPLPRGREEIDKAHLAIASHLFDRGGIGGKQVVAGGGVGNRQLRVGLGGDRRGEHEPRGRGAAELVGSRERVVDKGGQFVLEVVEAFEPGKRFVEAEEGHDRGAANNGQPLIGLGIVADAEVAADLGTEGLGAGKGPGVVLAGLRAEAGRVAGKAHVAEGDLLLGKPLLQQRFKKVVVLHPLGQAVADKDQRFPPAEVERQRRGRGLALEGDGLVVDGPLLVDLLLLGGGDGGEHLNAAAIA